MSKYCLREVIPKGEENSNRILAKDRSGIGHKFVSNETSLIPAEETLYVSLGFS